MYVLLIIAIYSDSCVEKTLIYYPHITKKCDICDMIQIETIFDILVKGFIIGVVVSAPLGPVGVLCIQRTLNKGRWYGFVTGLGASLSDIAYALLTGYGMSFVFDYINKNIFYLQLLGSVMLLLFGIYTFRSNPVQSIRPASSSKGSYFHNFITAFFVTLSNPLIIFLFIGLFAIIGIRCKQAFERTFCRTERSRFIVVIDKVVGTSFTGISTVTAIIINHIIE